MSDLPEAWAAAPIESLCDVTLGQSPPGSSYNEDGVGVPFFQGKAEFGELYPTVRKWTTSPMRRAAADDVLLSVRAPVGPTNLAPSDCAIGRGLAAIRSLDETVPRYVLYAMRASAGVLAREATGTTFAAINGRQLRSHVLPVAPAREQRRIVETIEEQFSRLDTTGGYLSRSIQRLRQVQQAMVKSLLGGWPAKPLRDVTINYDGRRIPVKSADRALRQGPFPYYGASGVIDTIDDYIFDGDFLLVAEDGANLATRAKPIAFRASGHFWVNNHAHVLQANESASLEFLQLAINAMSVQHAITGSAQPKLTKASLNRLQVPLPPIDEQHRIVTEVDRQLSITDAMGSATEVALNRSATLRRAILDRAFRGTLVPQDPSDEPASVLLERIAQKRATDQPKRARKKVAGATRKG